MRPQPQRLDRRTALQTLALAPLPAQASTFSDAALVPRSLVVNCVDVPATAAFYSEALGMTVIAERGGPTALERPKDFTLGVSSFDVDGGHFSLELQPAKDVAPASPDTDAVLYVQIALPLQFRASRMVKYGGELREGYGAWSVGAPGGLPLRLLVGVLRRLEPFKLCVCAASMASRRLSTPSTRDAR
jgi:catechol 2,3-dioxygenase-like lactoylglutathione lyase family enzyme